MPVEVVFCIIFVGRFSIWLQNEDHGKRCKVVDIRRLIDTNMFQTDVAKVFDFIRFSEKWDELYQLVSSDSYYQNMDEEAYEVVAKYANIGKEGTVKMNEFRGKDGKFNMCKGIMDLMENSKCDAAYVEKIMQDAN